MGPQLAVDGLVSNEWNGYFHSDRETRPWLQWHLEKRMNVTRLSLVNRADCCGKRLRHVEVRAGMQGVSPMHRGGITDNSLCGKFDGPGRDGKEYMISCSAPILADFVTVQLMYPNAHLQINELRVHSSPKN